MNLFWAGIKEDYPAKINHAIDHGININAIHYDRTVLTSLHIAAIFGRINALCTLLLRGADINAQNAGNSCTALHYAAENGQVDCMQVLLDNNDDISSLSNLGTPLHHATNANQIKALRFLITHGANIEAKNALGKTPLHTAIINGSNSSIQILIDAGANIMAANSDKKNALQLAVECNTTNNIPIVHILGTYKSGFDAQQKPNNRYYNPEKNQWMFGMTPVLLALLREYHLQIIKTNGRPYLLNALKHTQPDFYAQFDPLSDKELKANETEADRNKRVEFHQLYAPLYIQQQMETADSIGKISFSTQELPKTAKDLIAQYCLKATDPVYTAEEDYYARKMANNVAEKRALALKKK